MFCSVHSVEVLWKSSIFPCLLRWPGWLSVFTFLSQTACVWGKEYFSPSASRAILTVLINSDVSALCWLVLFPLFSPFNKLEEEILTNISFRLFRSWYQTCACASFKHCPLLNEQIDDAAEHLRNYIWIHHLEAVTNPLREVKRAKG